MFFTLGCKSAKEKVEAQHLPKHIGLIPHDPSQDTLGFTICQEEKVYPYFHHLGVGIAGEKSSLVRHYQNKFQSVGNENGYVTIRFIVNCHGRSGRFRMIEMDEDYQPFTFQKSLTDQLFSITSTLNGWEVFEREGVQYDYVRYLTFKIKNGNISHIIP